MQNHIPCFSVMNRTSRIQLSRFLVGDFAGRGEGRRSIMLTFGFESERQRHQQQETWDRAREIDMKSRHALRALRRRGEGEGGDVGVCSHRARWRQADGQLGQQDLAGRARAGVQTPPPDRRPRAVICRSSDASCSRLYLRGSSTRSCRPERKSRAPGKRD